MIATNQTGFMKGRHMEKNIHKSIEIATVAMQRKCTFCILSMEFHHCFDLCRTTAILGSLKYFYKIGKTYQNWVKLLFTEFTSACKNIGYQSPWETQTQGLYYAVTVFLCFFLCDEILVVLVFKKLYI